MNNDIRHFTKTGCLGNLGDALVVEIKRRTRAGSASLEHHLVRIQPEGALITTLLKLRQL